MSHPIRRIVTGHTQEGKAIFTIDEVIETAVIPTSHANLLAALDPFFCK